MSTLAPVDPDNYAWRQASDHSPLWQRRACGAEVPIAVLTGGRYFYSYAFTTALVDSKYSLQDLKRAARAAWRLLRYEEPHIAGTAAGVQGRPVLRYHIPKDEEEVEQWLDRTILVEASSRTPLVIRDAYEEDRKRKNLGVPEAARIYIAASVHNELTPLKGAPVRILFQVYTLFFDGIGFRCMIASFFRGLVAQLSTSDAISHNELDWRKSKDNLREAHVKLLAPEQYASGPEFNASVEELWSGRSPDSVSL